MLIKHTIAIFFFFVSTLTFSQSVQRTTYFSCSGDYSNIGTLQLQSNIGELMAITYNGAQNILTQGFVQPETPVITLTNNIALQEGNAFPNPVITKLTIELNLIDYTDITIEVYDILGKSQVLDIAKGFSNNQESYQLNFEKINPGIYFIRISSARSQFNKMFKVNKVYN